VNLTSSVDLHAGEMSDVQNNGKATKVGGVTGAGFLPGQSGNPGGRPKGSAAVAREACGGSPLVLAQVLREIATDEKARERDRISAVSELWDRGWGKPAMYAEIESADPLGLDEVSEAIGKIADETQGQARSEGGGSFRSL
jgi:hypothetical protein